jgi:hypothetical protein
MNFNFGNLGFGTNELKPALDKIGKIDIDWSKMPNMQNYVTKQEQQTQSNAWTDYQKSIEKAQVKPEDVTKNWEGYKGAQTKTGADYTKAMEPHIGKNVARMEDQYKGITAAQAGLAEAMANAQRGYDAERSAATNFFNTETKTRYDAAMAKAAAEYEAVKKQVQGKMDETNAYYQNSIKPQYAKLMEGGLSLRDASDPSNYVSKNVQNAYEGLVQKSAQDSQKLVDQTRRSGQADYGVLAALGAQARGQVSAPMTGAQGQLAEQASLNQASQAFQNAMGRVGSIEDQQRLYAQQARQTGLESGMQQSWRNYDAYGNATQAAQNADVTNYNAMLQGTQQLGNLASQSAASQFQGIGGLANARSQLTGDISGLLGGAMNAASSGAAGIGNLANTGMGISDYMFKQQSLIPEFQYQQGSGFNTGDYNIATANTGLRSQNASDLAKIAFGRDTESAAMSRADRQRQEDIELYKDAQAAQAAAAQRAAEAQARGSMLSGILGTVGTVGGGIVGGIYSGGNPAAVMAGSAIGGGVMGGIGNAIGGGQGRTYEAPQYNPYAFQKPAQPTTNISQTSYGSNVPSLNPYWQQQQQPATQFATSSYAAPTMQLTNQQAAAAQSQNQPSLGSYFASQNASQPMSIGLSPTMQASAMSPQGLELARQQYGMGVDPALTYSPYARYGLSNNPQFMRG